MDGACSQGSLCLVSLPYLRSRASHRTTSVQPTLHLSIPSFLDQYKMRIVAHSHIHSSHLLFLLLLRDGATQSLPWMQSLPLFVLVCGRLHASIPPRRSSSGPTTNQRKASRRTCRTNRSQTRRSTRTTRTTTTSTNATSTYGARTDATWITRTWRSQVVDLARSPCMPGSFSFRLRPSFHNTNHTFG